MKAQLAESSARPDGARRHHGRLTGTAWEPGGDLDIETWIENGRRFGAIGRASAWWIGDWLRYGNLAFGQRYARASRITGYDSQTLMNMVYVASAIPPEERVESLSWSHHAEVAALSSEDRRKWLAEAADCRLSVRCLRAAVRNQRRLTSRQSDAEDAAPATDAATAPEQCPHCGHELLTATPA